MTPDAKALEALRDKMYRHARLIEEDALTPAGYGDIDEWVAVLDAILQGPGRLQEEQREEACPDCGVHGCRYYDPERAKREYGEHLPPARG